ncbi:IclR family transcriptional regulator [Mycolicibacterium phocaicum]|uniref:IclR family transcriptional regulator n=1 Tax=Mycolicibacterium phocaicum TaxID=319706 RepID=A0A7I7ZXQ6_9MYCO|nr:IclR family transcriptional regulator [Mycolicibacterium phocaicum]TLH64007.1 IclR family transcriptional regulator [Mycolicibacterium phocaicum]BBZ58133.1 IclR family transcriptional regulator [Mycolicibacterium phocaicum]
MARSASGESVLERAVRILEVFDSDTVAVSVSDIAHRAGLPLSTASRLVDDLVEHGLLRRDPQRRIRIGMRLWELASRASPTRSLRDAAMPFMEDLHAVVGHHVQLGVLDGDDVLFIERLSAPGAVINVTRIAGRLPIHASSSGLVLLAHAPVAMQERIAAGELTRLTDQTIADGQQLRSVLAEIRRVGYALCPGHIHLDATGIAVPLRGPGDRVVGALSAIVPRDDHAISRVPTLIATARGIRRALSTPLIPPVPPP